MLLLSMGFAAAQTSVVYKVNTADQTPADTDSVKTAIEASAGSRTVAHSESA